MKRLPIYLSLILLLTCAKEDNTSLIEGYQLQISQLNSKITEYSSQVSQLQSTVNSLNNQVNTIPGLENTITSLNEQIGELESTVNSLNSQVNTIPGLENTITSLNGQIGELESTVNSLNSQVNTIPGLENTITSLNEQIGELEETIEALTSEASVIPDLNDEITSLEETVASLNEQIEELESIINTRTLTVSSTEGGSVTGGGDYLIGTEVTITATPDEGYEFTGWSDGTLESTIELTIENDITIEAFFAIPPKIELISEPLKMFTKGISDTLALSYNYSEGFDYLSISSQYGNVSIINEPNQGDTSGLISIEYITNLIENVDETSTISGSDIVTITVNGYESLSTEFSFQVRTQPEPQFKDYSLGTKETLNYFPHKLNIQKIRYLNQKDNQFTDVCWGENIIREYNRWGNVKDDLKNPVYADINNDGYFDIILHAVYQDGGIENYMIQDGFLEVYLYQNGEFVYSDILESHRYVNAFKIFPADFDLDGDVDLYILNSGRDANPFTGDRSVILENQFSNNKFVEHLLGQTHFTHGAAIVDIDQDGDLDIYESGRGGANYFSGIYRNLGNMNFLEVNNYIDGTHFFNSDFLDSEFNDIDGDGNIDKVGTYTEWGECPSDLPSNVPFCPSYNPLVFWGSNNGSLSFNNVSEIPKVDGFGVPLKIMFYDIDDDSNDEIILSRVGGSFWGDPNFYTGFYIQILDVDDNRNIIDVTNTYIENNQSVEGYCGPADYYLTSKISDLDNNGFIDLIGKSLYDSSNFLRWEWNGVKFIKNK